MGNDYSRILKFYTIKDAKNKTKIQAKYIKINIQNIYKCIINQ